MRATFGVAKATKNGALHSNHIRGFAADITANALPRSLRLEAPDGAKVTFDLSGDDESRDLSLTPKVITWINQHYGFEKLKWDYPHWDDARREVSRRLERAFGATRDITAHAKRRNPQPPRERSFAPRR